MVGSSDRRRPSRSGGRFPEKFGLGSQRMDGDRACLGMDQYENYFRFRLLCCRNPDWYLQAMARKGSNGPAVATRPRKLPYYPQAATGIASNEAVLVRKR